MYVINTMRDYIYNNFVRNLHTFFNKNEIMFVIKNPNDKIYDIKSKIKIVPEKETSCKRSGDYCIEFYSEEKETI